MAEITVRAETSTLGLKAGQTTTVEDSEFLRNVIAGGRMTLVEPCADTPASTPAPRARRRRGADDDQGDDQGDGEQLAEVVDARPPADPDAILADALVTVRPPDLPPAA